MTADVTVRQLTAGEARDRIDALSAVLIDCVDGGASVNFLAPLAPERADRFWCEVVDGVTAGDRLLLVAEDSVTGDVVGTVQVIRAKQENAPHRGELAKLLVHRSARGRGVGNRLMEAAEEAARAAGTTLLVLDTETGSTAERLYQRMGWTRVGVIPNYALAPDRILCATTLFYKLL
jgi:GNAT superfamily N-acetyltransferase